MNTADHLGIIFEVQEKKRQKWGQVLIKKKENKDSKNIVKSFQHIKEDRLCQII